MAALSTCCTAKAQDACCEPIDKATCCGKSSASTDDFTPSCGCTAGRPEAAPRGEPDPDDPDPAPSGAGSHTHP